MILSVVVLGIESAEPWATAGESDTTTRQQGLACRFAAQSRTKASGWHSIRVWRQRHANSPPRHPSPSLFGSALATPLAFRFSALITTGKGEAAERPLPRRCFVASLQPAHPMHCIALHAMNATMQRAKEDFACRSATAVAQLPLPASPACNHCTALPATTATMQRPVAAGKEAAEPGRATPSKDLASWLVAARTLPSQPPCWPCKAPHLLL